MTEWQPIETAPRDESVLAYSPCEDMGIISWNFENDEWRYQIDLDDAREDSGNGYTDYAVMEHVTHWMPLPEPPKE